MVAFCIQEGETEICCDTKRIVAFKCQKLVYSEVPPEWELIIYLDTEQSIAIMVKTAEHAAQLARELRAIVGGRLMFP